MLLTSIVQNDSVVRIGNGEASKNGSDQAENHAQE
jgi:hypothetical protein